MKSFELNKKIFVFGGNSKENTQLINKFKDSNENYLWFHLSDYPSSHGFYKGEILNNKEINFIGNILIKLSKIMEKNVKLNYTNLNNVETTKTNGLVRIINYKTKKIKKIEFNLNDYKI